MPETEQGGDYSALLNKEPLSAGWLRVVLPTCGRSNSSSTGNVLGALQGSSSAQPRLGTLQSWPELKLPRQGVQEKDGNTSKVLEMEEQKGSTWGEAGKEITFWGKKTNLTKPLFSYFCSQHICNSFSNTVFSKK